MDSRALWERYKKHLCSCPSIGLSIDISRMNFPSDFFSRMEGEISRAFNARDELEAGFLANPDEKRMVGHYWLRAPHLAPKPELTQELVHTLTHIKDFSSKIHSGSIKPATAPRFRYLLSIGIGGSALGPQFASNALGGQGDILTPYFLDNTDPDGFDRVFQQLSGRLAETLVLVISKSGGTTETRNGMLEAANAFRQAGLVFEKHAVAITGVGSYLDILAKNDLWLDRFPMWDWVGGRTSVFSAVGLLPLSLQGIDIDSFLQGAASCDEYTRLNTVSANPAALLALMWFYATDGKGKKDMVILPYKDRLQLFSKYLQQLIMESLGKERDLSGAVVNQGISVYGNKGTTDQHAYVQQLRDGVNNFFVTFIEVLKDRDGKSVFVEPSVTSGDYLSSFLLGTRAALFENGRESISITVNALTAGTVGALIALYERAVGFYATLVNINAYHQPGVEAGKKMASAVIELQKKILVYLQKNLSRDFSPEQLADLLGLSDHVETVAKILEHASANVDHGVRKTSSTAAPESRYTYAE
ncbi:MAG: glucose-6-phosphate isomerase [Nitrospiraceae bacterium]|nr:glucose-6-phosphate isomerase [Nitrospiraceae bacterium]